MRGYAIIPPQITLRDLRMKKIFALILLMAASLFSTQSNAQVYDHKVAPMKVCYVNAGYTNCYWHSQATWAYGPYSDGELIAIYEPLTSGNIWHISPPFPGILTDYNNQDINAIVSYWISHGVNWRWGQCIYPTDTAPCLR